MTMFCGRRNFLTGMTLLVLLALSGCDQGNLKVTLSPQDAVAVGAQWAVDGGDWQASGATVEKLKAGDHVVSFKPVDGWNTPADNTVTIVKKQTLESTGVYTPVGGNDVTVPDASGSSQATATAALVAAGLVVGAPTQQCSFTVPLGNVIGQTPAAGTIVAPGSTVVLVISTGPCDVTVPDVAGQALAAAEAAVAEAGLVVGTVTEQCNATVQDGTIISQTPAAGGQATAGTTVDLLVSTGICDQQTPNVVGIAQAAAETAITQAGLVVGTVKEQCSNTVALGLIISQTPAADAPISLGASVHIIVSTGGCNIQVPGVVGQTQAAATAAITGIGLAVGNVTQRCSFTVAVGSVVSQSPVGGEDATLGSKVDLTISTGPCPVPVPNVVELTQAAAVAAISSAGLTSAIGTGECNNDVPLGSVIRQEPAAGGQAAAGSVVTITVSTGGCTVTVPNVVGMTEANAATAITAANLTVGNTVTRRCHATAPAGTVIEQTPAANGGASPGSAVVLTVSNGPCPASVPGILGLTRAQAESALRSSGLVLGVVTDTCSTTVPAVPAGQVISQSPAAQTSVPPSSAVAVFISTGPCPATVPDLSGKTQAEAAAAIGAVGLTPGMPTGGCSDSVPLGKVIGQDPPKDTTVPRGTTVNYVVSTGVTCKVTVPDTVGQTQAAANSEIEHADLVPVTATPECSNSVSAGNVIRQTPAAGQQADRQSTVNLTVSTGSCRVTVPNVTGKTQAAASSSITGAGLVVGTVSQQCSNTVASGNVISQTPAANASMASGGAVDLVVSSGACAEIACSNTLLTDGDFESGLEKFWTVASTAGSKIITNAAISGRAPHAGSYWAWFGGAAADQASLAQSKTIPIAGSATLTFYLRILASGKGSGTLTVSVDGTVLGTYSSKSAATFANYTQVVVDLSAYANGNAHTLTFAAGTSAATALDYAYFFVDDVCLSTSATLTTYPLTISRTGAGGGTVSGSGINCGGDCAGYFTNGSEPMLNATPDSNSVFEGWAGVDSEQGTQATVIMDRAKTVTASFAPRMRTLSVAVSVPGGAAGRVTGYLVDCTGNCPYTYAQGTRVVLTATANAGSKFTGWTGADSANGATCTVTMSADKTVTAIFARDTRRLTLSKTGTGSGRVTSSPAGIDCGSTCFADIPVGTQVFLTQSAAADSSFTGWGGDASGGGSQCSVTMSEDRDVSANFAPLFSSLSVTKNTGGSVTSNPAGINCGTTCDGSFRAASSVQLTAAPTAGYVFTGWSGAATGTANPCTVVMNGSKTVNATFALSPSYALTISSDGTGSGTVTSNGTGISCPADCTESYLANEVVTLTAAPNAGSTFSMWTGADVANSTATTCTVTMSAVKNVKATFVLGNYALNVSKGGNGQGTVTATGIDCPGDCSESYPGGTSVSMTADPMENSNFTGWTGGITSTTNPYSLTMNAAKNVTANFTLKTYTLTTAVSGQGTISPAAGPHTYNSGDTPEITASAAQGWKFDHWTGDLAGSQNPMELSVNGNKSVTAVFVLIPSNYTLQVTKTGSGSVTADGNGINCGQDCSESYPSGRVVTLTARADSGYTFEGWGGALSGATNPINITMDAAKTVSAVFNTNGTTYLQVENQASFPIVDLRVNGVQILPAGYQMNCSTFSPLIPVTGTKVTFYAGIGYLTPSGTPVTYRGQGPVEIDVVPGEVNPVTLTATLGELLCKFTDRWVYDTTDYCAAGSVNYRLVFYWDGIPENDGKWELYKWINLQEPAHWDLAFSGRATARYWNCGANPVVFKFNDPPYMVDQTYYPQLEVGSNGYDLLHIISPCDQSTILFCRDSSKLGDLTAPPLK